MVSKYIYIYKHRRFRPKERFLTTSTILWWFGKKNVLLPVLHLETLKMANNYGCRTVTYSSHLVISTEYDPTNIHSLLVISSYLLLKNLRI